MEINKINLDGTEYEIGGGSKLYRHLIKVEGKVMGTLVNGQSWSNVSSTNFEVICDIPTELTQKNIAKNLANLYVHSQYGGTYYIGVSTSGTVFVELGIEYPGDENATRYLRLNYSDASSVITSFIWTLTDSGEVTTDGGFEIQMFVLNINDTVLPL